MIELPDYVKVAILAVVQGIAEFLPISSSGHILIGAEILGDMKDVVDLSIFLHGGTLLSILVFYRKRILDLLRQDRRVIPLLVFGTLPAVILGFLLKSKFEFLLEDTMLAGFMFVVTGFMLIALSRLTNGKGEYPELTIRQVLIIGCFQAIAILPGISRSGMTIFAGAYVGLRQQAATTFSFLLAIPVILGASILEIWKLSEEPSSTPLGLLIGGAAIAFFVGLVALRLLVGSIERGKLHLFAYYVIPLGLIVASWQIWVEFKDVFVR